MEEGIGQVVGRCQQPVRYIGLRNHNTLIGLTVRVKQNQSTRNIVPESKHVREGIGIFRRPRVDGELVLMISVSKLGSLRWKGENIRGTGKVKRVQAKA